MLWSSSQVHERPCLWYPYLWPHALLLLGLASEVSQTGFPEKSMAVYRGDFRPSDGYHAKTEGL
jgi:hypothetical protein